MRKITGITATVLASLLCVFNFTLPGTALADKLGPSADGDETALSLSRNEGDAQSDERPVSTESAPLHRIAPHSADEILSHVDAEPFWTADHAIALARLLL